jgi:hypothetical protein
MGCTPAGFSFAARSLHVGAVDATKAMNPTIGSRTGAVMSAKVIRDIGMMTALVIALVVLWAVLS